MYKKIPQRVFVHETDEVTYLPNIQLNDVGASQTGEIEIVNLDEFPVELDTVFPQKVYLVYQQCERLDQFFDEDQPGLLITLYGFCVYYKPLGVLLVNASTGEPHIPPPRFCFSFVNMERTIGKSRQGSELDAIKV